MIPGTIGEWKAALASSRPGVERGVCVSALMLNGATIQANNGLTWHDYTNEVVDALVREYRVKPTTRPWSAEDARRHVGFAYRNNSGQIFIIGRNPDGTAVNSDLYWTGWQSEYATPIPGTDPSAWNWQKCEVVE